MENVRFPAVAGLFYPGDARELKSAVAHYLDAAQPAGAVPKAIIAPHAGYVYSGPRIASRSAVSLSVAPIISTRRLGVFPSIARRLMMYVSCARCTHSMQR